MSQETSQNSPPTAGPDPDGWSAGHRQQPPSEGHGGRGSDSAMKQMREWEQQRAANSVEQRQSGPD